MVNPIEIINELEEKSDELLDLDVWSINEYDVLEGIKRLNEEQQSELFEKHDFYELTEQIETAASDELDKERFIDIHLGNLVNPINLNNTEKQEISEVECMLSNDQFYEDMDEEKKLIIDYENNANYGSFYTLGDVDLAMTLLNCFSKDEIEKLKEKVSFEDLCDELCDIEIDYMDYIEASIRSKYDL